MSENTKTEETQRLTRKLDSLVGGHFYWVEDKHEGWQPAQYSGFEHGQHMFWPIGMDYQFDFFTYFKDLGDEIIHPNVTGDLPCLVRCLTQRAFSR